MSQGNLSTTVRDMFERERVPAQKFGKSRTEQHHKNLVNINTIMAKAKKTGLLPFSSKQPFYGDFTNAQSYFDAKNSVIAAEKAFMALPANIRSRFKNDPVALLDFLDDESNRQEAIALGIIQDPKQDSQKKESTTQTSETPVISEEPGK